MAVEMKEMVSDAVETGGAAADVVTGGAVLIAEAAGKTVRQPARRARSLERRGARVNRRIARRADAKVEETVDILDGLMPERLALAGLRLVRGRARRTDLVGSAAYRVLTLVNGGLEAVLTTITKLERASTPPARPGRRRANAPRATASHEAAAPTSRRARAGARRGATTRRRRSNRDRAATVRAAGA